MHLHLDIWSILHKLCVLTVCIAVYPDQFDENIILLIEWPNFTCQIDLDQDSLHRLISGPTEYSLVYISILDANTKLSWLLLLWAMLKFVLVLQLLGPSF